MRIPEIAQDLLVLSIDFPPGTLSFSRECVIADILRVLGLGLDGREQRLSLAEFQKGLYFPLTAGRFLLVGARKC